jgi:hypothetical protein
MTRAYDELLHEFEGVLKQGQMMGSPALVLDDGRMIAFVHKDRMSVKLGRASAAHAEALGLAGSRLFHPGDGDRVFYDWVTIAATHGERWSEFVQRAIDNA